MHRRRVILKTLVLVFLLLFLVVPYASADKASVTIEAPHSGTKGSAVVIKIHVSHNANNIFHYTKWASVKADGEQLERWDYSWRNRPEGKEFTREVTLVLDDTSEIVAEASCNLHGSQGPVRWVIKAENQ
jgi:desulfoferrodoxin (superoxide reductase-like protein)